MTELEAGTEDTFSGQRPGLGHPAAGHGRRSGQKQVTQDRPLTGGSQHPWGAPVCIVAPVAPPFIETPTLAMNIGTSPCQHLRIIGHLTMLVAMLMGGDQPWRLSCCISDHAGQNRAVGAGPLTST